MSIARPQISVKILHINEVVRERNIIGKVVIQGKAEGKMDEEEAVIFDFKYTGKGKEDKNEIMEYLKERAWDKYIERDKKMDRNTLDSLIEEFMNY